MNRNVESHFSKLPHADIQRSILDRSFSHKTSFNVGELIPFYVDEVLPGDTFKVTTSKVVRLQTLLTPVMDNMYLDTYYFFVPNRLVWKHWKQFMGENTESAWVPTTEYAVPCMISPSGGWTKGTIADYMGVPLGVNFAATYGTNKRLSALPFRAYALICNEWFRDENLTNPLYIPDGDEATVGSNGDAYITDIAKGGKPFQVSKYHDYFTSSLPNAQRGEAVTLAGPLTDAPVVTRADTSVYGASSPDNMVWKAHTGTLAGYGYVGLYNGQAVNATQSSQGGLTSNAIAPDNLWADLSNTGLFSISALRLAFQLQRFLERDARGGTRYTELLKSHFGVTSPDSRLQRPEYLGGNRVQVAIHEVKNTAQSEQDFLGDLGAMSVTHDVHSDFTHSFTEHGYVIGVCCLRYDHSYPQGLERFWTRRDRTDFYWPVFANIGEQPVYTCEIYASDDTVSNSSIFGYQEAWADYRYKPDRVSSEMRPGVENSLASWHFADYYTEAPTLSDRWIREDKTNVDRTLAVTSSVADQAFMDIYVKNISTRPLPVYSIPGLIDHH